MPRAQIAATLFRMKRDHTNLISIEDELYSADELLSMFAGREVSEQEGKDFIAGDSSIHDSYNPLPVIEA